MNAIFIFSTPWAFDTDQRIHEERTAAPADDTVGAERQSWP
jgi:hypothetical protein